MTVVCVHPRYLPHGFVDEVPDMQETVDKMMQCCRDKKAAASFQKREERDEHSQQAQELLEHQVGDDNLQSQQENQADVPDTLPFPSDAYGTRPSEGRHGDGVGEDHVGGG